MSAARCKFVRGFDRCILDLDHGVEHDFGTSRDANAYVKLAASIGQLVAEKQVAYGDSFGKSGAVLRILYPEGIALAQLDDALTIVRVLDKLFRIATDKDAFGESPWKDIVGYGLLAVARRKADQ